MNSRLLAAPAAAALVVLGIAIGSGAGASANQRALAGASANQSSIGDSDSVTTGGLTAEPSQVSGCPLPGGSLRPCSGSPSGRAPGHLPLAAHGLLIISTPRLPSPRPAPPVRSITVVLGVVPRHATDFKRIVVRGRARPNPDHTRWTFRLPRHIAGNELDLVLNNAAVEGFGVTTNPRCA